MSHTYTVYDRSLDGREIGLYVHEDANGLSGPEHGTIIELGDTRWRVVDEATSVWRSATPETGNGKLLVRHVEDFEGLDDVEMAARHADQTRAQEQGEADNDIGPSAAELKPEYGDRYT
jgi:hypothetical protein